MTAPSIGPLVIFAPAPPMVEVPELEPDAGPVVLTIVVPPFPVMVVANAEVESVKVAKFCVVPLRIPPLLDAPPVAPVVTAFESEGIVAAAAATFELYALSVIMTVAEHGWLEGLVTVTPLPPVQCGKQEAKLGSGTPKLAPTQQ